MLAFVVSLALLGPHAAHSAPKKITTSTAPTFPKEERPLQSIEVIRAQLVQAPKKPSPAQRTVRKLSQGLKALKAGKTAEAIKIGVSLQSNETWGDYGFLIAARARKTEAASALQRGEFAQARELARKAIQSFALIQGTQAYSPWGKQVSEEIALSELIQADAFAREGKLPQAHARFESAFQRLSSAAAVARIRPENLESYAKSCRQKPGPLCAPWLHKLASLYPKASPEMRALLRGAVDPIERPKPAAPTGRLTATYKARDTDIVAFETAMEELFGDHTRAAKKSLNAFLDEFPRSSQRFRARYWLAQIHHEDGDKEKAKKLWEDILKESPLSWYGLLSAIQLGRSVSSSLSANVPIVPTQDPNTTPLERFRIQRAELLLGEGLFVEADHEIHDLKSRPQLSSAFLYYLANLHDLSGNHSGAFVILSELIQRSYEGIFTQHTHKLIFPIAHRELIERYAAENKLDPVLVISLIKQESAFENRANSSVGAMGLMQLMPATATGTDPNVLRTELLEFEHNVRVGTKYLKEMLDRFDGNTVYALAAYNAGPGAVNRWVKEGRATKGMIEFVDRIPYKETRDYVGSIIRNYYWYSPRFGKDAPKTIQAFWKAETGVTRIGAAPAKDAVDPREEKIEPVLESTDPPPAESAEGAGN